MASGKIEKRKIKVNTNEDTIFKYFYRSCPELVTLEDFDDEIINDYIENFEEPAPIDTKIDDLMIALRSGGPLAEGLIHLNVDETNLLKQQRETGRLSLKRILATNKMRDPSLGHLLHFDKDLPYIAFVRFDSSEGEQSGNRGFKPVEFYQVLKENFSRIKMIQSYVETRGSRESTYSLVQKQVRERELGEKIERYFLQMKKVRSQIENNEYSAENIERIR